MKRGSLGAQLGSACPRFAAVHIARLPTASKWFVVLLGAITALAPLGIDTSLPALPVMAHSLRTSDAAVQATLGAFILAFALGQLVAGPLADRYGRRPMIIVGMAIFACAGISCALAANGTFLVASRFVQGLGASAGSVVGRAMVRDICMNRSGATRLQAYVSAISGVVPMLAPLLGIALLPFGWRAIYGALIAGAALLLVATFLWLPETRPATVVVAAGRELERYQRFLQLPRSTALCALIAASFAGIFAFISESPFVLVRELGLSNAVYSFCFAVSSGAILGGSWLAGALAERIGSERLLGGAAAAAGLLGIAAFGVNVVPGHPPAAWLFVAVMAGFAFTFGILTPTVFATGLEPAGNMAGVAAATLGAGQMAGGALGSTLTGMLPFDASVNVGWSVGVAGLATSAAYMWSRVSAGRAASRPAPAR